MKTLGDSLRNAREAKSLTQIEVAKISGIHNKTISNYENGVSSPDPEALRIFADVYETTVDYLLGRTDNEGKSTCKNDRYTNSSKSKKSVKKSVRYIDVSDLPDEAIKQVVDYIELLRLKYKASEEKLSGSKDNG